MKLKIVSISRIAGGNSKSIRRPRAVAVEFFFVHAGGTKYNPVIFVNNWLTESVLLSGH